MHDFRAGAEPRWVIQLYNFWVLVRREPVRIGRFRSFFGLFRLSRVARYAAYSNTIQHLKTASAASDTRQLTIRLPSSLLLRARAVAKARGTSVSELVRGALEDLDREALEAELVRAYKLIGGDSASDVDDAFELQAEVARRG
jgi:hypothetical protein